MFIYLPISRTMPGINPKAHFFVKNDETLKHRIYTMQAPLKRQEFLTQFSFYNFF